MSELRLPLHDYMYRLPKYYRTSNMVNDLMHVEGDRTQQLQAILEDIVNNCYISTATWGLDIFEEMAGIPTDPSKPIGERRSILLSRYGGFGTSTIPFIRRVASNFQNGNVEITNQWGEYTVRVEFISTSGIPTNLDDVKRAIEQIIPAHYYVTWLFRYITWDTINQSDYTWEQWDALNLEWRSLRESNNDWGGNNNG